MAYNNKRKSPRSSSKDTGKTDNLMARKRSRYLGDVKAVDINDYEFLRRFVTDHGKIIPARLTGASAKQQRLIKLGVRRARNMGLLA